jgi:two-component system response regulator PilR (NtrC family)
MLEVQLRRLGHAVETASDPVDAAALIERSEPFDIVVTDLVMPNGSGLDVLAAARARSASTQIIVMTAYATTQQAVEAMRLGAYDYLQKPFKMEEFRATLEKAIEKRSLLVENAALRASVKREFTEHGIVGRSAAIQRVRDLVRRMAASAASVLITGESGTGKEVVARALHSASPRAAAPFVTVNCGALPEHLMESELFGHEKGSFTGADKAKEGLFRAAQGGTLFLDEIGEMPLPLQVKLLRVLQERSVRPVGSTREVPVDVRVLAATNRFLEEDAKRGAFRQDLYYRLNVLRVHLPPLRERPEDVELLARHFVEQQGALAGRPFELAAEVGPWLAHRKFHGNIRELENLILRATALAQGDLISIEDFLELDPPTSDDGDRTSEELEAGVDLDAHLAEVERRLLYAALERCGGVRTHAAKLLGMSFRSFRYRIAKFEGGMLGDDP